MFDKIQIRPDEEGTQVTLHDLEADVMDIVWDRGWNRFAVRDVLEVLEGDREIAYTTVMTTVKRLYDKGLFEREKDGRRYLYSPVMSREEFHEQVAVEVLDSLPESAQQAALSTLIDDTEQMDPETLDDLEAAIERRKRELDGGDE